MQCKNTFIGRHDTQHNDIQHNDIQHNFLLNVVAPLIVLIIVTGR
jgi:hypothetical protein